VTLKRCYDFYQPLGADAQYLAILAREFPARLKKLLCCGHREHFAANQ
jgi:hypothetical protein